MALGLAERLANGFDDLGPGVVVGMDTPYAVGAIVEAFPAGEGLDAVGLADDVATGRSGSRDRAPQCSPGSR